MDLSIDLVWTMGGPWAWRQPIKECNNIKLEDNNVSHVLKPENISRNNLVATVALNLYALVSWPAKLLCAMFASLTVASSVTHAAAYLQPSNCTSIVVTTR